jgi:hypothetical protein
MNERIKLLKEQSMEWVPNMADPDTKIRLLNAEKFALLIVKECASVCHTHGWGMLEHGMSGHNIADDCGTLIKEHFGVEE